MSTVVGNILDPIHETLPVDVWDHVGSHEPKLKAQHSKWIRTTVEHVLADAGYTHMQDWLSLVLTGSLTTFQYDKHSDCDISLFVDVERFPEWSRAEMIGLMVDKMDGTILPGTPYQMQCFVVASNVTKQDLYQPGLRSGWDIDKHEWIEPPDPTRVHDVEREMNASYAYALEQADKMERLLRYEPDKAVQFWHQIHRRRRRDQQAGKGDYSDSNIVYKFLANRDLFPKITEVSGEYIAKTAAPRKHKDVAKFAYDPIKHHLVVGQMAAEEGAVESHSDIVHAKGMDRKNGLQFGQIGHDGRVEMFSRPAITGYGKQPMNQYEADWRLKRVVKQAFPEAQFKQGLHSDLTSPRWEERWTEPHVEFLHDRPVINADPQAGPYAEGFDFEGF